MNNKMVKTSIKKLISKLTKKSPKSKCNVKEKYYLRHSDELICNQVTGKWVERESMLGRALAELAESKHPGTLSTERLKHHPESVAKLTPNKYVRLFYDQIKYMETLPKSVLKVLKRYTTTGYFLTNTVLRSDGHDVKSKKVVDACMRDVRVIDQVFKGIPPLKKNIRLWRGVKMDQKMPDQFIDKGYISTTVDRDVALAFSRRDGEGTLFEIHVPRGTRVMPLYTVSMISPEIEVLLPRYGTYTILKQDYTPENKSMVVQYTATT